MTFFVTHIETALLSIATKADSITDFKFMPVGDLKRIPSVIVAILERGGHCDLFFQKLEEDSKPDEHL